MVKPVRYRQWASKSDTILRKTEVLFGELMNELDIEDPLVDEVDNIMLAAQDAVNAFRRKAREGK